MLYRVFIVGRRLAFMDSELGADTMQDRVRPSQGASRIGADTDDAAAGRFFVE